MKMFQRSGKYFKTYNPRIVEEHIDSSDFEDDIQVSQKQGHHSLVQPDLIIKKSQRNQTCQTGNKRPQHEDKRNSFCDSKIIQVDEILVRDINYKNTLRNIKHNGDYIDKSYSKRSFFNNKIIPSLTCMFRRTNNTRTLSFIKNIQIETILKDNSCQVQFENSECEHMKKLNQQSYTVRPVYTLERNIHQYGPHIAQYTQVPYYNTIYTANLYSNDSELEKQKQKKLFVKRLRKELRKEYERLRVQHQPRNHVAVQNPSVLKLAPALVYTTHRIAKDTQIYSDYNSPYFNDMPSSSSGFWDYLFDRIKKKYQTHRAETPNPCFCIKNNNKYAETIQTDSLSSEECCSNLKNSNAEHMNNTIRAPPPFQTWNRNSDDSIRVECQCHPDKRQKQPAASKKAPTQACDSGKSCQEPHEELSRALAKQYNAEILCIHNPPCILVNGCLNIPLQKEQTSASVWNTITQPKKGSFFKNARKCICAKKNQDCQYIPTVEVRQCQTTEHKSEKKVQSLCDHNPPCEIVRCCYRNRYDPSLANSCVHVPICQKVPECVLQSLNKNLPLTPCNHVPKCQEKPVCSRGGKYIALTANQTIGTQVKPQPVMICRHEPPCIMIPKCLGRVMCDNYIPHEAIPKCVHQPLCDMIPACCRRTKEMVSAGSQYPNGCRVV